jgi:hypothetical protein
MTNIRGLRRHFNGGLVTMMLSGASLVACGGGGETPPPDLTTVAMGATISRTGVSAVATWVDSFDLAAADLNGGIKKAGYPFAVNFVDYIEDTMNMSSVTVARALDMVHTKNIKMVLDGTSGDSLALNALMYDTDTTNDINIPVVCVACSSTNHHNPNAVDANPANQAAYRNQDKWHFGLSMSSLPQSLVISRLLLARDNKNGDLNGDGKFKLSIIAIDDPFGTTFAQALTSSLKAARPDAIVETILHPKTAALDTYDWAGVLTQLTDAKTADVADFAPDAIVEITFPQFSLALIKAYTAGAYVLPFFHTHSMREQPVVVQAGHDLDGQEGTSYMPSDGMSGTMFDAHFTAVTSLVRQSQWDAHVYDGGVIFGLGVMTAVKAGADPATITGAQIRDAMLTVNNPAGTIIRPGVDEMAKAAKLINEGKPINYEGASGPCDFDAYGRALNRISHWKVTNQKVNSIDAFDCVANPATCPPIP